MAFKITFFAILLIMGCSFNKKNLKKYTPLEYYKNYALSTCIADGYESKEVISDSAAAARGYLELGEYPLEAHTEATLLGRKYLKKKYKSKSGSKLILMKCIDFYYSKELNELSKKYE